MKGSVAQSPELLQGDIFASHPDLIELDAQPHAQLLLASEAFPDVQERADAQARRFLGGVALLGATDGHIERPEQATAGKDTLLEAVHLAALGDEASASMVRTNVITDIVERLYKAAHQTRVELQMVDGKLEQDGRSLENVNRNTLEQTVLNAEMLRRAKYELRNVMLFQEMHTSGLLDHFDAVVWSPSSTGMSQAEKQKYGFFLDTESCSIQLLQAHGDRVVMESAFVAGKRSPASERHDLATIRKVAQERGLVINADDGTDMISQVMLIPKGDIQGVEDVVRWYDDALGGTFYGQDRPRQDYRAYAVECLKRNESFNDIVEAITGQLIREAHTFKTPMDALHRLDDLSARHCLREAAMDESIDTAVFGSAAAAHVADMRFFIGRGDVRRAEMAYNKAVEADTSGSCPFIKRKTGKANDADTDDLDRLGLNLSDAEEAAADDEEGSDGKKKMKCPFCKYTEYDDPCAKTLSCGDCRAMVSYGKVVSKGDGGSKERAKRQEAMVDQFIQELFRSSGSLALAGSGKQQ